MTQRPASRALLKTYEDLELEVQRIRNLQGAYLEAAQAVEAETLASNQGIAFYMAGEPMGGPSPSLVRRILAWPFVLAATAVRVFLGLIVAGIGAVASLAQDSWHRVLFGEQEDARP